MEESTRTLLGGDLFTQGGAGQPPITESDILGFSEAYRGKLDYFSHTRNAVRCLKTGLHRIDNAGLHALQRMV
jgi:hypothetical protein